jgi:prevent-host-death family protein
MTDLRQNMADLINRAAYGGERIVLVSHGEPKAAIISIEELRRLDQLNGTAESESERWSRALAAADEIRERIRVWQEAHGIVPEDSVETLNRVREERDAELSGLR